ncbi:MAG: 4-(cytidine 5'-diphospho)-2-C-methyl-D-erythritol kinase [Syntrophomonadaceae bacterium]|nr:4-(cytidine 5'-diphospho)-2-C-methyl-D-erythritol kinase [Syntrophomonadaceae bacterium]
MDKITIEAPAKINLTLDIKGKRSDGYHELETVMHHISLVDYVTLEKSDHITVSSNSKLIPNDESNLAYKAAKLIFEKNGKKAGVNIYIEKNIPVGAGLAGGSTNAAAVLLGLNKLYDLHLSPQVLEELALELGSDVPFCLADKTALAKGRGEKLTFLPPIEKLNFLLVKPDFQVSTAQVYKEFSFDKVQQVPDTNAFLKAWHECDIISLANNMQNVLESVCLPKYPEIGKIKLRMLEYGALNALMSGSGPTVFGLFDNQDKLNQAYAGFLTEYKEVFKISSYIRSE